MHPRVRITTRTAVALVAAAYVLRAFLHGWDFRPELPLDALLGAVFLMLLAVRSSLARAAAEPDEDEPESATGAPAAPDGPA